MASIDWPSSLPKPLANSIREKPLPAYVGDKAEVGKPRRRKRFSRTLMKFTFKLRLTDSETAALRTFRDTTTDGGVEPFNWTHPVTAVAYVVEFASLPEPQRVVADLWDVDIELEET